MSGMYAYTARNLDGQFVAGALQARSGNSALAHLRGRALFVTSIRSTDTARGLLLQSLVLVPVSASARVALFRALATLTRAAVPLRRALEVTIEQCGDRRLKEALRSVAADIEAGALLSTAMSRRPHEFSALFVAMVRAGETGGVLDEVLERLAEMLERNRAARKRLSASLAYPSIVAATSVALVAFLVTNVVPAFEALFRETHVRLPALTRIVIDVGACLRSPFAVPVVVAMVATIVCVRVGAFRIPLVAESLDRARFSIPVWGPIARNVVVSRVARTLGTLLRCGVPVLVALASCEEVAEAPSFARALSGIASELRGGRSMAAVFRESGLFDAMFLQLVYAGEETGSLDSMLLRLADYLDVEIESGIAALGSVVEPLLVIVLGAVVGGIVASVLIPLYSIIGSIR